ncbi:hypothetical protein [Kineosporia babensis]|uniref:Uncharacterized protein n=1 Tax=Kineosporia babensis TaxID=499548 RepID=A0A9X1NKE2_9ACTN|nr:hypothetical protein [Kineosporia babensis]MCD5316577.1 hypothetical protein [Kineosporia babensis]
MSSELVDAFVAEVPDRPEPSGSQAVHELPSGDWALPAERRDTELFTVVGPGLQPPSGNPALILTSRLNLGLNASEFRFNRFVVILNNRRSIIPTWADSNRMKLALPAGEGGTPALLEIRRRGSVVGWAVVSYRDKVSPAEPVPEAGIALASHTARRCAWVLATGGPVVLRASDLGCGPAQATATVDGQIVQLRWLSETTAQITVPPGHPGSSAEVVLCGQGITTAPILVGYAAGITGITRSVVRSAGAKIRVTGVGLSGTWVLRPIDAEENSERDQPLEQISVDDRGRNAEIELPPAPAGVYEIRFTPCQETYPGAVDMFTSKAVISYSDQV